MLTTQVSVSMRMARPKPCRSFTCISGITDSPDIILQGWDTAPVPLRSVDQEQGTAAAQCMSDDTISPGKSTPSQQEPAANSTALLACLN